MSLPKEWLTEEGALLKISKTETNHIQNCIRMLEHKPSGKVKYKHFIKAFTLELAMRKFRFK